MNVPTIRKKMASITIGAVFQPRVNKTLGIVNLKISPTLYGDHIPADNPCR